MRIFLRGIVAMMMSLILLTSCQHDATEQMTSDVVVDYSIQVFDAMNSKAIGDDLTAVDKLYYEVYRQADIDDLQATPVYEGFSDVSDGHTSFALSVAKNQNFVVLFWAQDADLVYNATDNPTGMYKIDDLRAVSLFNAGAANNVAAQVFAGSDTITNCVSAVDGNVTLIRPISQINIATSENSLKIGENNVKVCYKKSAFNVFHIVRNYDNVLCAH